MDEKALIKACIENDRKSQKILYDTYSGQMYAICQRYMKHDFGAQEALQRGFIKVFSHLNDYRNTGPLGGWIRRIMVTTCIEELRKEKRLKSIIAPGEFPELPGDEIYDDEENYTLILEVVNNMPEGYRLVFSMYVLDDMSHAEIAAALKITESTSRTQLLKARKYLQKILNKQNIIP